VATAQAVELVARALRGEVFTPQLQDAPPPGDRRGPPGQGAASGNQGAGARPGATDQPGADGPPAGPGAQDELSTRRKAADGAESPAERPARDGAAKARKAQAAQRPARNGGAARRKTRSSDKQAAAG
jgi:hypothetical protein